MLTEWHAALTALRTKIDERSFDAWIAPIQCTRDANGFHLAVGSDFAREWIHRHYLDILRAALAQACGEPVEIRLVVGRPEGAPASDVGPRRQPPTRKQNAAPTRALRIGRLIPQYTFENFVVGPSNELAYGAAQALALEGARNFNPFFLWGGVGLGKTHLISAIAHAYLDRAPRPQIAFLSAEEFMNQMIVALRQDQMNAFRARFRELDMLVVDDIEFIAGKERTQEEFFHTFDALYVGGKQVVLTSDKPPQAIPDLAARLRSRFEGGLNADIKPPTDAMRMEIVRRKAAEQEVALHEAVVRAIVARSGSSVRELEGALTRVLAWAELRQKPLDERHVAELLGSVGVRSTRVAASTILAGTSRYFRIDVDTLRAHTRDRATSEARQVAMYLCRHLADMSYAAIAQEFGGRDHSTVLYAVRTIEKRRAKEARLDVLVAALERSLREDAVSSAA